MLHKRTHPLVQAASAETAAARSARAEVRNPLLCLASANDVVHAPEQARWLLARALELFHAECSARAQRLWKEHQPHQAALFKAAAVYAGHIRRLALHRELRFIAPAKGMAGRLELIHARAQAQPAQTAELRQRRLRRNALRSVNALQHLRQLPSATRLLLCKVLDELSQHASQCAEESWKKHKAPMAAYHLGVAAHARRLCIDLKSSGKGDRP